MSKEENSSDILWDEAHEGLKMAMQKEIGIMREVLANMHQEELALLMSDKDGWNQVMQQRGSLIERLGILRLERQEAAKKIENLLSSSKKLESCEIFSLRDQLLAIVERMNRQNNRNEMLFNQLGSHLGYASPIEFSNQMIPETAPKTFKRKTFLATYDDPRYPRN
ncbi:MAG: hypothetical protein ACM3JI_00395 [Anaerolineae bacterium]